METGTFRNWLQDPRVSGELRAEAKAEGRAEGEAEGIAKGKAEGEAEATRRITLAVLTGSFGKLPESLVAQIATMDTSWCERLVDRSMIAKSLTELIANLP